MSLIPYTRSLQSELSSVPTFDNSDLVTLSHRNIKTTRPSDKWQYEICDIFPRWRAPGISIRGSDRPEMLSRLHLVNLLEPYTPPSAFPNRFQQPGSILDVFLKEGDVLKLKDIAMFKRLAVVLITWWEFLDKSVSERSWTPLSDILNNYDELLERFHRRHSSRPRPSSTAKSRNPISNPTSTIPPSSIPPIYDPLAHDLIL